MFKYDLSKAQGLSSREKEVLSLVRIGMTNDQIGKKLLIAYNTVRAHLRRIYAITGMSRYQIILEGKSHNEDEETLLESREENPTESL